MVRKLGRLKGKCFSCGKKFDVEVKTQDGRLVEDVVIVCNYCGARDEISTGEGKEKREVSIGKYVAIPKKKTKKIHEMPLGKVCEMED